MKKTALVSFIYPKITPYLGELVKAINDQTSKDFVLLLFNDGLLNANQYFNELTCDYQLIELQKCASVNEVRWKAIQMLNDFPLDYIIFQDADDLPSANRVESAVRELQKHKLTCCNTLPFFGKTISKGWEDRLANHFVFDASFIRNKNILGLGNTALRVELLKEKTVHSERVVAYDWFFFYQLLEKTQIKALFDSESYVLYRQHDSNIAGMHNTLDSLRLQYVYEVLQKHYEELIKFGFDELKNELNVLRKLSINQIQKIQLKTTLFWWEEISYYENK